ncbi:MAG: hypothetical protein H6839_00095 [Planctomycetes bacterium]|nr:hypothetical protein [Planctomycetota bacterium]
MFVNLMKETNMARLEGSKPRGLYQRAVYRFMKRMLGRVPEPVRIAAISKPVFKGRIGMEQAMQKLSVPPGLVALAQTRVAQRIGCPF